MSLDISKVQTDTIDLGYLRNLVRTPGSRAEHVDACVREFVAALPESMADAFRNPPAGTKAEAVVEAVKHTHEILLTVIAAAFMGEAAVEKEREPVVKELGDTLEDAEGDDFDPDFREPVPQ